MERSITSLIQGYYYYFFIKGFIYLLLEGEGGWKRGRETSMCERYIDRLPLAHPQLGTWPATQACALTGNRRPSGLQAGIQSTETHQPGKKGYFLEVIILLESNIGFITGMPTYYKF